MTESNVVYLDELKTASPSKKMDVEAKKAKLGLLSILYRKSNGVLIGTFTESKEEHMWTGNTWVKL